MKKMNEKKKKRRRRDQSKIIVKRWEKGVKRRRRRRRRNEIHIKFPCAPFSSNNLKKKTFLLHQFERDVCV